MLSNGKLTEGEPLSTLSPVKNVSTVIIQEEKLQSVKLVFKLVLLPLSYSTQFLLKTFVCQIPTVKVSLLWEQRRLKILNKGFFNMINVL